METIFGILLPLVSVSVLAFWSKKAVFFMVCYGLGFSSGLEWFDAFGTHNALTVSMVLITYAFSCGGLALYAMVGGFQQKEEV